MAKADKQTQMTVDEENEEKAKYGGVLLSDIKDLESQIKSNREKSQTASGLISRAKELFKKKGGNVKGFVRALKDLNRDMGEVMDEDRSYQIYFRALGGQEQIDMFDQMIEQRRNGDSVAAATAQAGKVATPSMGSEVAH